MTFDEAYDRLVSYRVRAFADGCRAVADDPSCDSLGFLEKVALAVEEEARIRHDRRVARLNKDAGFADPAACLEDVKYLPDRSLRKDTVERLGSCGYIKDGRNVIVTSSTGAGKSFLVQALGNAACRRGHSVRYLRHADFCRQMAVARRNEEHYEIMDKLESVDLLLIDDLFLEDSDMRCVTDLLEVVTHRESAKAPIVIASQLSPEQWHLRIDTKIIADALLDRIVQNAYRIMIEGPNMREYFASKNREG